MEKPSSLLGKAAGNPYFIGGLFFLVVIMITAQNMLLSYHSHEQGLIIQSHYNNYLIFKQSFFHLIGNKDLYQLYPSEHWDFFKYSPAFSLLFAPLAILPDALGLFLWNSLNVFVLFFALWNLPFQTFKTRLYIIGVIIIELITSVQNSQSNGLIAGLIIYAFILLERKKTALASLFIVLTIAIKLFGFVALALFIFYPDKFKAVLYALGWTLLLAFLPLLVISFSQLSFLYQSWAHLLYNDHSASMGLSVQGWIYSWFGLNTGNMALISGIILFCLPFLQYKYFSDTGFRLLFLSSILVWIVIFNHKAESPTYIIAMSGVAIWYFSRKFSIQNTILLVLALIFTVLSPTDLFPKSLRNNYVTPLVLKAVPCILIWCKITFDLIFFKPGNNKDQSAPGFLSGKNSKEQRNLHNS
jgi:hypothetical protein